MAIILVIVTATVMVIVIEMLMVGMVMISPLGLSIVGRFSASEETMVK